MEEAHSPFARVVETALPTSQIKRTRRKTPKTRQGCSRCKSRRIKCDEERPACRNCVRNDYKCPEYQQGLRWSQKYERLTASSRIESYPRRYNDKFAASSGDQLTELQQISLKNQRSAVNADHDVYWQATTIDPVARLKDTADWNTANVCSNSDASESQYDIAALPSSGISQTPTHLSTMLIEHWLRYICPMISTFDSEINYNRRLARSTWDTSKPVFYTMQAMSAICLADSMPQLKKSLPLLRMQAIDAINQDISHIQRAEAPKVTADLVFAVFMLGTSLHWTNSVTMVSEHPWLELARDLLSIWKSDLSSLDVLFYSYFCQALTYWKMLVTAAGRGLDPAELDQGRQQHQNRSAMQLQDGNPDDMIIYGPLPYSSGQSLLGTRPNSWCGVSNEVIDVFRQVLALCRSVCDRRKPPNSLAEAPTNSDLCDDFLAQELHKGLLSMDFSNLILRETAQGFPVQTRDENTPVSHLLQTAESYRLAGLLQLRLAFGNLTISSWDTQCGFRRVPTPYDNNTTHGMAIGHDQSHGEVLLALTLQLVKTLEEIPAQSGSRSIHAMLYLSAAAGLRFEKPPRETTRGDTSEFATIGQTHQPTLRTAQVAFSISQHSYRHIALNSTHSTNSSAPSSALEVSRARSLVLARLSGLQRTLPNRTTDSTLQLVQAIWREYDNPRSDSCCMHWLDIMRKTDLGITLQ